MTKSFTGISGIDSQILTDSSNIALVEVDWSQPSSDLWQTPKQKILNVKQNYAMEVSDDSDENMEGGHDNEKNDPGTSSEDKRTVNNFEEAGN